MPRALRVCRVNNCVNLTRSGKCDECQRKDQATRNTTTRTEYNEQWRRVSKTFLHHYPLCFSCGRKAQHVDHIDGKGPKGPRGLDWSNLQALCRSCHSKKTAQHDGGFGRWFKDG